MKFSKSALKTFTYFVQERENIRRKKDAGEPKPWTKDVILQTYKFCNIHREHDRVTRWVNEHIRQPYADHPHLWFMLCIARQINWPDTLEEIMADKKGAWPSLTKWSPDRLREVMLARQATGAKLYTGAYMINAQYGKETELASDKAYFTAYLTCGVLWKARKSISKAVIGGTLENAHNILRQYRGWGDFLTAQVIADWKETAILANAIDWWDWAVLGPGSVKGLNRMFAVTDLDTKRRNPLKTTWGTDEAIAALSELRDYTDSHTDVGRLCLQDMQNCLCEYQKYMRTLEGTGRPRSHYAGTM